MSDSFAYLSLHKNSFARVKNEKGKRKERKDIDHSNRLPRCSNFPHPLPSSVVYFWERGRKGEKQEKRMREEWIKTWLCTTGSPAFKQYKTKGKRINGRDVKCLVFFVFFFLRFLVNNCVQNLKLSTLVSSPWPFFCALKVQFGEQKVSPYSARPKRSCYVAVT